MLRQLFFSVTRRPEESANKADLFFRAEKSTLYLRGGLYMLCWNLFFFLLLMSEKRLTTERCIQETSAGVFILMLT